MKNSLIIRYATADNAELLSNLGRQAFREAFEADNTPENMTAYLSEAFSAEKQRQEVLADGSLFLIAEIDGAPGGYARLLAGPAPTCITGSRPVELLRFYLLKKWIGQGFGAALMQACLSEAQQRNHDVIWLGVWERNARAIAFYQKWGFEPVGNHTFHLGDDPQIDVVMQKLLG